MVSQLRILSVLFTGTISFARARVEGLKDDFVRCVGRVPRYNEGARSDRAHEPAVNGKELSDDACTRTVENAMKSNWIRPLERE